jgi:hypothetical protein
MDDNYVTSGERRSSLMVLFSCAEFLGRSEAPINLLSFDHESFYVSIRMNVECFAQSL